jgi:hypothetical protein
MEEGTRLAVEGLGVRALSVVIPAKAGIHGSGHAKAASPQKTEKWIPAFAGMTNERAWRSRLHLMHVYRS